MKKTFLTIACLFLVVAGAGYLFKGQLWEFIKQSVTADMFIAADTDNFDPGLAIGETFPDIRAIYQGRELTSVGEFVHDKGMVFITNRSADW